MSLNIYRYLLQRKTKTKFNLFIQYISKLLLLWLTIFLLLLIGDNIFAFSPFIRSILLTVSVLIGFIGVLRYLVKICLSETSLLDIALEFEKRYSINNNIVVNAFQLSNMTDCSSVEKVFLEKIVSEAEGKIKDKPIVDPEIREKTRRLATILILMLTITVCYFSFYSDYAFNALLRYIHPTNSPAPICQIIPIVSPGSDVCVLAGDSLTVKLKLKQRTNTFHLKLKKAPLIAWFNGVEKNLPTNYMFFKFRNFMLPDKEEHMFIYSFRNIEKSFTFRIFADRTFTEPVTVSVLPIPNITFSVFEIFYPEYVGKKNVCLPGPPADISCLANANLKIKMKIKCLPGDKIIWQDKNNTLTLNPLYRKEKVCSFQSSEYRDVGYISPKINPVSGKYKIICELSRFNYRRITLCEGIISIISDIPPTIDFTINERNINVTSGSRLSLPVVASDDFGLKEICLRYYESESVLLSSGKDEKKIKGKLVEKFTFRKGRRRIHKTFKLFLSPENFIPGRTYILSAYALDFYPDRKLPAKSSDIVIRILSLNELTDEVAGNKAFEMLRKTIKEQRKANAITDNISLNFKEILTKRNFDKHRKMMSVFQSDAQFTGSKSIQLFAADKKFKNFVKLLKPIIHGEMTWVIDDIIKLKRNPSKQVINVIRERQQYILNRLLALAGEISKKINESNQATEVNLGKNEDSENKNYILKEYKDKVKKFLDIQKRIVKISEQLRDKDPDDLTEEEKQILGKLAREEAELAKIFEEALTDFSKLPEQDFSDSSIVEEFNEVFQEIQKAAEELYKKKVDIAVPLEQSGLEKAEELVHNLERWLPDTPDFQKWEMEEPDKPHDIPLAELPEELEDIVGELLDSEESMTEDIEDVTSSWMDSLDKGAGWDAMDGPISNMSAKGVTGNRLPNNQEIGGRSGEGRTGKSHGQIVEASAEGKGGRKTPSRLTPQPFEQGSIKDESLSPTGGSTGGGKLSGFTGEGLHGPAPPELKQKMARLAGRQSQIRQKSERLLLKLRRYNLPSRNLENAIKNMKIIEQSIVVGNGQPIRRAYSAVLNSLRNSKRTLKNFYVYREYFKLKSKYKTGLLSPDDNIKIPDEYQDIIKSYFKRLAESE